jgi:hypothetical protein
MRIIEEERSGEGRALRMAEQSLILGRTGRHDAAIGKSPLQSPAEILRWPLPRQGAAGRCVVKALSWLARSRVMTVRGLEHVRLSRDPFILALNHSNRTKALLVPALLVLHRDGLIHFLADWNFRLIPGIGQTVASPRYLTAPWGDAVHRQMVA